ncbi:MAG: flavin reductase [bacterium]|nr:flavin reductase [bacterium]
MKETNPLDLNLNPFKLVGEDWMLISAGNLVKSNCMTASWGGMGVLWNKNVAFIFIRPVRYTYQFVEKYDYFTLSFFCEEDRKILQYCGKYSGREKDKAEDMSLHVSMIEDKSVMYKEAKMSILCKKIYFSDIDPKNFIDGSIDKNYPQKDYHRMYVGEIERVLIKD